VRPELKKIEEYFLGLTKEDFIATSDLVKSFMKAYWNELNFLKETKLTPEIDYTLHSNIAKRNS